MNIKYRHFPKSKFVAVTGLFVFIYLRNDNNAKRYKGKSCYLPKGVIQNCNIIIYRKNFYEQHIDPDIK